jgi:hypothetical protein
MSTIAELAAFLERESKAADKPAAGQGQPTESTNGELRTSDGQQEARPVASAPENP